MILVSLWVFNSRSGLSLSQDEDFLTIANPFNLVESYYYLIILAVIVSKTNAKPEQKALK